jgi:hypothetical protein
MASFQRGLSTMTNGHNGVNAMNKKLPERDAGKTPPNEAKSPPAFPAPEEELGGGDFCSLEEQPSTDDDTPLD